jgi:DNA-binding NtrC family response regulator
VESCLNQGTTFKIYFPTTSKAKATAPLAETTKRSQGNVTILLVEDDANLRPALCSSLRKSGHHVFEARNGLEATKVWAKNAARIDLLLSDMVMPGGLSGIELAAKFTNEKPSLKVIVSSGYNNEMAKKETSLADNILYLQKPFEIEVLAQAIHDIFQGA